MVRRRTKSAGHNEHLNVRDTKMLDAEVVDTLFQFDSIVSELEKETLIEQTPSPLPPSSPTMARKASPSGSSQQSLEQQSPTSELSSSFDGDICQEPASSGPKQSPSPPRPRALPNVNQLKQQFLSPRRPASAPLHRESKLDDVPHIKGNVKNLIAQMQTTPEVEHPCSLTPPLLDEQMKKRHSKAIQSKITELNQQLSQEKDSRREKRQSRSYTPPMVRRKIQSPFLVEESEAKSGVAAVTSPNGTKEQPQTPVSPQDFVMKPAADLTSKEEDEVSDTPTKEVGTSPEKKDSVDESKTVAQEEVKPPLETGGTQAATVTSPPPTEADKSSEPNHLVSFLVLSPPHKKPSKKKVRMETPPPEEVATPQDIELTFDKASQQSEHRYETPRRDSLTYESPHHVEVVIGVKENGVYAPPKIVDDEERSALQFSSEYDHLMARSLYDHLSPLEPGEDPYKPFQRHRSASDVTSHRIRPLTKSSLRDELGASEVGNCLIMLILGDIQCVHNLY